MLQRNPQQRGAIFFINPNPKPGESEKHRPRGYAGVVVARGGIFY